MFRQCSTCTFTRCPQTNTYASPKVCGNLQQYVAYVHMQYECKRMYEQHNPHDDVNNDE